MTHLHYVYDEHGDITDYYVFCSDSCLKNSVRDYAGWNGCHEIPVSSPCAHKYCENVIIGIEDCERI